MPTGLECMPVPGCDPTVPVIFVPVVEDCVGEPVWVARCAPVLWEVSCEVMIPGVVVSLCLCS